MNKNYLKQFPILLLVLLAIAAVDYFNKSDFTFTPSTDNAGLEEAFANQQSDVQVQGEGIIVKLLADDLQGSRHQKFIVEVQKSFTVLISHNIDIAPRINDIKKGERISFFGEYVYNNKGGLVHWTHHDPGRRHIDGWLKYRGKTYQ